MTEQNYKTLISDSQEESDIDILIVSPVADKIKPEIHKIAIRTIP